MGDAYDVPSIPAQAIEDMFRRQAKFDTPESDLVIAVLVQGLVEATAVPLAIPPKEDKRYSAVVRREINRKDAIAFLNSDALGWVADMVGIGDAFVREVASKIRVNGYTMK